MSRTTLYYKAKPKAHTHIHSLRGSCFIKTSAFKVAGNLVMVVKFTFQSVQDTTAREVARSHSSCIVSFDLIGQHQNKRFYVTEIVLLLEFADAIFRRERSDDRKCVCCSLKYSCKRCSRTTENNNKQSDKKDHIDILTNNHDKKYNSTRHLKGPHLIYEDVY